MQKYIVYFRAGLCVLGPDAFFCFRVHSPCVPTHCYLGCGLRFCSLRRSACQFFEFGSLVVCLGALVSWGAGLVRGSSVHFSTSFTWCVGE